MRNGHDEAGEVTAQYSTLNVGLSWAGSCAYGQGHIRTRAPACNVVCGGTSTNPAD